MVEVTFLCNERKIGIQELLDLNLSRNVKDIMERRRANTKMLKKEKGSKQFLTLTTVFLSLGRKLSPKCNGVSFLFRTSWSWFGHR